MPTLVSIQVGRPKEYGSAEATEPFDRPWRTGFYKSPVSGPVYVGRTNLEGDGQADLEHHGGSDKAVLAYSADHYPGWREELSLPDLGFGGFGENLTVAGLDETAVCVGDVWSIGEVSLEVSQPRQPCWKLARRWGIKDLTALVIANGRSGWYLRVLAEGKIEAGQEFGLVSRPNPDWRIAQANEVMHHRKADRQLNADLASLPQLARSWQQQLHRRIGTIR